MGTTLSIVHSHVLDEYRIKRAFNLHVSKDRSAIAIYFRMLFVNRFVSCRVIDRIPVLIGVLYLISIVVQFILAQLFVCPIGYPYIDVFITGLCRWNR